MHGIRTTIRPSLFSTSMAIEHSKMDANIDWTLFAGQKSLCFPIENNKIQASSDLHWEHMQFNYDGSDISNKWSHFQRVPPQITFQCARHSGFSPSIAHNACYFAYRLNNLPTHPQPMATTCQQERDLNEVVINIKCPISQTMNITLTLL